MAARTIFDRPMTKAEHQARWRARKAERDRMDSPDFTPYLTAEAEAQMWDRLGLPLLETEPVIPRPTRNGTAER